MSDEPQYYDIDGKPCTLDALCVKEPAWAASRHRSMLAAIKSLESRLSASTEECAKLRGWFNEAEQTAATWERRFGEWSESARRNDEARVAKWATTVARVEEERDSALRRLGALLPFVSEIWETHRDKSASEYNECDVAECAWCSETKAILGREARDH